MIGHWIGALKEERRVEEIYYSVTRPVEKRISNNFPPIPSCEWQNLLPIPCNKRIVLSPIIRYTRSRRLYSKFAVNEESLKIRPENEGEKEKAVDALPGDNLFRTLDRSDRPVFRQISGNWVGPFDPFPPRAPTYHLWDRINVKSGRPALECISTKVSIIVPLHTSSSFDDVSSPKESTKSLENSKKEDSTTPFWCPPSRSSREAHATIVDERGWNIRAKKMGAFRFCNEIGYRRYNSRSVNPSIIVSAAITLPRLTII